MYICGETFDWERTFWISDDMMGELMKEIVNGRTSNLFCIPEPYRNVKFTVLKHSVRRMVFFTPNLKRYYCTLYSTVVCSADHYEETHVKYAGKHSRAVGHWEHISIDNIKYVKLTGDIQDSSLFLIVTLI